MGDRNQRWIVNIVGDLARMSEICPQIGKHACCGCPISLGPSCCIVKSVELFEGAGANAVGDQSVLIQVVCSGESLEYIADMVPHDWGFAASGEERFAGAWGIETEVVEDDVDSDKEAFRCLRWSCDGPRAASSV